MFFFKSSSNTPANPAASVLSNWFTIPREQNVQQARPSSSPVPAQRSETSSMTLYKNHHEKHQEPAAPKQPQMKASAVPPVVFPPVGANEGGKPSLLLYKQGHEKIENSKPKSPKSGEMVVEAGQGKEKQEWVVVTPKAASAPSAPQASKPDASASTPRAAAQATSPRARDAKEKATQQSVATPKAQPAPAEVKQKAATQSVATPKAQPAPAEVKQKAVTHPAPIAKTQPSPRRSQVTCGGPFVSAGDTEGCIPVAFFDERRTTKHWREESVPKTPKTSPMVYTPQPSAWLRAYPPVTRPAHLRVPKPVRKSPSPKKPTPVPASPNAKTTTATPRNPNPPPSKTAQSKHTKGSGKPASKKHWVAARNRLPCPGPFTVCGNEVDGIPAGFFDTLRRTTHWSNFVADTTGVKPYVPQPAAWLVAFRPPVRPPHLRAPKEVKPVASPIVKFLTYRPVPQHRTSPRASLGQGSPRRHGNGGKDDRREELLKDIKLQKELRMKSERLNSRSLALLSKRVSMTSNRPNKVGVWQPRYNNFGHVHAFGASNSRRV